MDITKTLLYVGIFIVGFILISIWNFYSVIRPPKINIPLTPADFGLVVEEVSITTVDRLTLSAWLIENPGTQKKKRAVMILHGYPADKRDMLSFASRLNDNFTLLLLDMRYFGKSDGAYTTFGVKERHDVSAAIDFLTLRGYEEVGILGFSLGGGVALLAAAEDKRIKAVASYASFADLPTLGKEVYSKLFILKKPMVELEILWSRVLFGTSVREVSPVNAAKTLSIPILIIHPKQDEQIPFSHALLLKDALAGNSNAQFLFPDGRHGDLPENIYTQLKTFFSQ